MMNQKKRQRERRNARRKISGMIRREFGFDRTACDCRTCTAYCKAMPGYMIPSDLPRMKRATGAKTMTDLTPYLQASQGPTVAAKDDEGKPITWNIPTIRPALGQDGCFFLADGKCTIHHLAPYGCAFFDAHQTTVESDRRSKFGLHAIHMDILHDGPYVMLLKKLLDAERVVTTDAAEQRSAIWEITPWCCDVCGADRGESQLNQIPTGGMHDLRYCIDKPVCCMAAKEVEMANARKDTPT